MLWLKECWQLWQHQRGLAKLRATYRKKQNHALTTLNGKERRERLAELDNSQYFEENEFIDQSEQIHTQRLLRRAQRLRVPIPHTPEDWEQSQWNGGRSLTESAYHTLRTAIRKEEGERRALWEWWLKTIGATVTAATGLGGVVIGILAFLAKK